ncbi:Beige/BEACH domain protein [Ancylostoma ceylanicum]|uniref:Beige/BEACH domain protein n=1 Tax=Ancylostoma ceylanicum TaxID=53326 RepID=A0A0D6LIB0_9BILA|nr:Beige/BEACH domain protein [Ancylostoma ceylanicum]
MVTLVQVAADGAFMKPPIWDENTFKDVLIPAVVSFVSSGTKDVDKVQLLSSTVVFRKVDPHDERFRGAQINTGHDSDYYCWKDIATRFGVCYCRLEGGKVVESEFRPFRVIPHIVPMIAIIESDETLIVVYDELGPDWVDLNLVLRYSYSNIEQHSQIHNFAAASVADVYFQLDRLRFYVRDPLFLCDNVFWLLCDPFASGRDDYPHEDFAYQSSATSDWVNGKLSNYDYISMLNKAAGRVRGEVHNHPIFPWVCDFKQKDGGWRDLTKTKYRLTKGDDQLGQNFRHLSHHIPEVLSDIGYMVYKARVESKSNLCKHVRSNWVPREYPASMTRMYEWTPDECIPEFYDDPSILVSKHSDMPDLELPPFVSSPEEFIKWHREMLESDEVSRHLHEWIDLNFGHTLSGDMAVDSLNVHMCFSEPKTHRLRTNGVVQLFYRPHPKRLCGSSGRPLVDYDSCGFELKQDFLAGSPNKGQDERTSLLETYRSKIQELKLSTPAEEMFLSFVHTLFRFRKHFLRFIPLQDFDANNKRFVENSYDLPRSWLELVNEIVHGCSEFTDHSRIPFYLLHTLDIPMEVISFHDTISQYYSYHLLRKSVVVQGNEERLQAVLLREIDALKNAMGVCAMENSLVRLFERMIADKESAVQTVHRLFIVVCRSFDDQSFEQILKPLVGLLACESSVKLLDRRFLLPASIAYGTSRFLKEFLPTVIEAVASLQIDRSVVAKESVVWLSKRYGPVISARFITANLLRVLGSCYTGMALLGSKQEPESVFTLSLVGDECGARVEACLTEIAATYSVTFVTVQYLPFCVDLVEQATKRLTAPIEAGLLAAFRIVRLSAKSMTDHQLMNYLEDYIVEKVIVRVLQLTFNANVSFFDNRSRIIVAAGAVSLLYNISMRIGLENTRMYARKPFELMFETFGKLYEADEQLKISPKKLDPAEGVASIPLWFVSSVIDRFASSWGVPGEFPVISSANDNGVSVKQLPFGQPIAVVVVSVFTVQSVQHWWSGIRAPLRSPLPVLLQRAHVGSASHSCPFERELIHFGVFRQNCQVSTGDTLWSIKPELDVAEAQQTYSRHQRSVQDVTLLANNLIASTDGVLHVWDPFRGAIIAQLDWDSEATICGLAHVDRHSMAAISSLHSTVRMLDTRTGCWTSELKVSNLPGLTRAFSVRDSGRKMVVALSNGTIVVLDARTGRLTSLSHGNNTHTTAVKWLNETDFLVCDADEPGSVFAVNPRICPVRKLADTVTSAFVCDDKLVTLQAGNVVRVYTGAEAVLEAKMKSDSQAGSPSSICYLPLNNAYLIGSNQGSIRLMC